MEASGALKNVRVTEQEASVARIAARTKELKKSVPLAALGNLNARLTAELAVDKQKLTPRANELAMPGSDILRITGLAQTPELPHYWTTMNTTDRTVRLPYEQPQGAGWVARQDGELAYATVAHHERGAAPVSVDTLGLAADGVAVATRLQREHLQLLSV
jgi:hypothetical protein